MHDFKKIKNKAKKNLYSHYFLIMFTCLVSAFIGIEFTGSIAFTSRVNVDLNLGTRGVFATIINAFTTKSFIDFITKTIFSIIGSERITNVILILLGFLVSFAFWALIKNVYRVISRRIILEARTYKKVPMTRFTYLFRIKKWFKVSMSMLVYSVKYILWCFTVAGIFIKRYEYFLVPYILSENPNINGNKALELSKNMMYNHKLECFLLELSFIGYDILGIVTFGLSSVLFSNGYKSLTYAEYYYEIRKKYIEEKSKDYNLLIDEYLFKKATNELLEETYKDVYELIDNTTKKEYKGISGFLYNYFGINLYDDKTTLIYDEQELNEYKISYYSKIINGESYPTRLYPLEIKRQRKKLELMNYTRSYSIPNLILIFFSFSFVGWLWEVMLHIISSGKFVNRGVLHGPWLPIYGSGAILIMLLLKKFRTKPALEFSSMILVCGLVEYFTAVYLETKFGIRWWNYDGYFLNIQGRVCAEGLLVFGLGGMAAVYFLAPTLDNYFKKMNKKVLCCLSTILLCLFIFDKIYSGFYPNTGEGITNQKEVIKK